MSFAIYCYREVIDEPSIPRTYEELTMDRIFLKSEDFVQREIAGECLLIPLRNRLSDANSIFVLNETGAAVWHRLDGVKSMRDILGDLSDEYEATWQELEEDADRLIKDLLSIEAIRQVSGE